MRKPNKVTGYPRQMSGLVKRHPDGFGFFIPDDTSHPDAYIPAQFMLGVMTQDRVTVSIDKDGNRERYWARIEKIDKRHWSQIVAPIAFKIDNRPPIQKTFRRNKERAPIAYLKDTEGAWGQDLIINEGELKTTPQLNDLVVVEISHYPDQPEGLQGKITKILGPIEEAQHDIERVARAQSIPLEFSKAAIKQSKQFKPTVDPKSHKDRKDLRDKHLVTIDGATAKDFDDAIYVENSKNGYTLYIAIADVSHYVEEGSPIDKDAYERGTSSYFPNYVIPMLPEVLSNELCSLKPKVVRLAFVCQIEFDHSATMQSYQFYEALMESKARVTYGQAQEILDGQDLKGFEPVLKDIRRAEALAKKLLSKRLKEGSLDLEMPEIQVLVDSLGEPVDIIKTHRIFAHRMIEEFMLSANVATAMYLEKHSLNGLYRIHESPKPDALEQLGRFAQSFGLRLRLNTDGLQVELRSAIEKLRGTPQSEVFSGLVLRSMKQAKYSPDNIGHFGLAFEHYAHFTSPIRRYPDLIAHRLIKAHLKRQKKSAPSFEEAAAWGTWLSACEQRSVKAERAIIGIKKARFIEKYLGEEFSGVIASVTKFGVFVLLRQFEVEGLVHIDNLSKNPNSKWEFDEDHLTLHERRSGKKFQIGDEIEIQVVAANIMEGKIDFMLAGADASTFKAAGSKNNKETQKTGRKDKRPGGNSGRGHRHDRKKRQEQKNSGKFAQGPSKSTPTKNNRPTQSPAPDQTTPSGGFDPGKKLIEALQKKGLKPSGSLVKQEFGQGVTQKHVETDAVARFGKKKSSSKNKKRSRR